jgi:hypothetical protein
LTTGAIERQHELSPQLLSKWVLRDECLELGHELGVTSHGEVSFDPPFEREQTELLETRDRDLGERLVDEFRERRSSPQRERLSQLRRGDGGLRPLRLGDEILEPVEIELARPEPERVAGGSREDLPTACSERLPELRHADPQGRSPRFRRVFAPELVDETVARDDLVRTEKKDGEERALLGAAERDRLALVPDLEWPENAELHC